MPTAVPTEGTTPMRIHTHEQRAEIAVGTGYQHNITQPGEWARLHDVRRYTPSDFSDAEVTAAIQRLAGRPDVTLAQMQSPGRDDKHAAVRVGRTDMHLIAITAAP